MNEIYLADLYQLCLTIERILHQHISRVLKYHHGEDDNNWWLNGVPPRVTAACEARRRLRRPTHTSFRLHHPRRLEGNCRLRMDLFAQHLPSEASIEKDAFLSALDALRTIRNRIMHPGHGFDQTARDSSFSPLGQHSSVIQLDRTTNAPLLAPPVLTTSADAALPRAGTRTCEQSCRA